MTTKCTECERSFPNGVTPIDGRYPNEAQCLFCAIRLDRILNNSREDYAEGDPSKVA